MEAVKIDKLTDQQLNDILSKSEEISADERSGKITAAEARDQVAKLKEELVATFDRDVKNPLRKLVWDGVNDILNALTKKIPQETKFKVGDTLDLEARTKIQEAKRVIRSMKMSGVKSLSPDEQKFRDKKEKDENVTKVSDEKYALIRIKMVSDYSKFISEDHAEMKALRQLYHDTCLDNYEEFAKTGGDPDRNAKRDEKIAEKIAGNLAQGKYSNPNRAQAVINLLKKPIG